jgi:hypothetical protein
MVYFHVYLRQAQKAYWVNKLKPVFMGWSVAYNNDLKAVQPLLEDCSGIWWIIHNPRPRPNLSSIGRSKINRGFFNKNYDDDQERLHVEFVRNAVINEVQDLLPLDASWPYLCYWTCQSLDFLDAPNTNEITKTIAKCQSPTTGGFGDDPNQLAHLACTSAAICTLIGTPEAYSAINLENLKRFLDAIRRPDGTVQRWWNRF